MKKWNKILKLLTVGGFGAASFVAFWAGTMSGARPLQPIAFNHKKHAQHNVTCDICHPLYRDQPRAGIPGVKTCIRCHEEIIYRMPEKDKIQEYRKSGTEIPWPRVYRIEPDIYGLDRIFRGIPSKVLGHIYGGRNPIHFSHRRHTAIGKVECNECHGDVANMERPVTRTFGAIEMDGCISCHKAQEEKVSVDCATCHS
jgi:hypothetical protein